MKQKKYTDEIEGGLDDSKIWLDVLRLTIMNFITAPVRWVAVVRVFVILPKEEKEEVIFSSIIISALLSVIAIVGEVFGDYPRFYIYICLFSLVLQVLAYGLVVISNPPEINYSSVTVGAGEGRDKKVNTSEESTPTYEEKPPKEEGVMRNGPEVERESKELEEEDIFEDNKDSEIKDVLSNIKKLKKRSQEPIERNYREAAEHFNSKGYDLDPGAEEVFKKLHESSVEEMCLSGEFEDIF